MKKVNLLLLSFMAVLMGSGFISCSSDDDKDEKVVTIDNKSEYDLKSVYVVKFSDEEEREQEEHLGTIKSGEKKSFSLSGYEKYFIVCDIDGDECESPDYTSSITLKDTDIDKWPISPGNNSGGSKSNIIGTWVTIQDEGYEIYNGKKDTWNDTYKASDKEGLITFYANGTYENEEDEGTWTYSGNTLTSTSYEGKEKIVISYKVLNLTSTSMVVEYSEKDKDYELYEKVTLQKISN